MTGSGTGGLSVTTRPLTVPVDLLSWLPEPRNTLSWVKGGDGLVGWGTAAAFRVRGPGRFARALEWWQDLMARARIDDEVGVLGTGPVGWVDAQGNGEFGGPFGARSWAAGPYACSRAAVATIHTVAYGLYIRKRMEKSDALRTTSRGATMYIEVCSYRVKPGRREEFLEHFETEGLPAIRAHGIRVLGPLPDLENPNRFMWLRSFGSREERDRLNRAFHHSAAWVNEIAPIAMPMLQSWDFVVCETSARYTQDDLGG